MTIEDKLKSLIIEKYGSMVEFANQIDMANSTLATIMQRGIHKASVSNVIKICQALDISADELAKDKIVPNGKMLQTKKHMTDIEEIVAYTKMNIMTYSDLTLNGKPLDYEDRQCLIDAVDLCIEFIKRRNSRKEENK